MYINMGGNEFWTNLREARAEARRYAEATIYKFEGVVLDSETISLDSDDGKVQSLYLLMCLGEGCSDASWDVVRAAMDGDIIASRLDYRWQ